MADDSNVEFEVLFQEGNALQTGGRPAEALQVWNRIIERFPESANARYNRGCALLTLGRSAEALSEFAAYLERQPDDLDALVNYGKSARALKRLPAARAALDRALAVSPECALAYAQRALVHLDEGDDDAAVQDYDRALAHGLDGGWIRYNRALARKRIGDREGAISDLDVAIRMVPDDPDFWQLRGALRLEMGDAEGARDRAEAVRLDPRRAATSVPAADGEKTSGWTVLRALGGFLGMLAALAANILFMIYVAMPLGGWLGWTLVGICTLAMFPIAAVAISFKIAFGMSLFDWGIETLFNLRRGRRVVGAGILAAAAWIMYNVAGAAWQAGFAAFGSLKALFAGGIVLTTMVLVGGGMLVTDPETEG